MKYHKMFWSVRRADLFYVLIFIATMLVMTATIFAHQTKIPTATPTPDGTVKSPPAKPDMTDMRPSGPASKKSDMGDDMMGAAGLVPPGIMVGKAGRWMVGYQVMLDKMSGNLAGTRRVSDGAVLTRFMASPTDMTMQMHMGMLMYSPTDKLTLMVMVPFIRKSMNHVMSDSTRFNELTKGVGDVELRALYVLYAKKNLRHRFLLNAGIGLPTGSINQKMGALRLEYPMQLGSGTFSLGPGFTYLGQTIPWGWGAEFLPTIRIGRNSNGYRLGNRYQPSVWGARQINPGLSVSVRLNCDIWQNVRGADTALDVLDEPTKDPRLQGGKRFEIVVGTRFQPTNESLRGQSFFVHAVKPVFQSLDGPQLGRRWAIKLGWQYEF